MGPEAVIDPPPPRGGCLIPGNAKASTPELAAEGTSTDADAA